MIQIGSLKLESPFVMAPISGMVDSVYRYLVRKQGAALTTTGLISADGIIREGEKTLSLLPDPPDKKSEALQLFGNDPEILVEAVKIVSDNRFINSIDLNLGCPVKKITKEMKGAALLKNPKLAHLIIRSLVKATDLPVTVKLRTGWDQKSINIIDMVKTIEDAGVAAICIHGRYATQLYSGKADWELIGKAAKTVNIPVIGNGDILSAEDAIDKMKKYDLKAVMIGRAAFGNPFIFDDANRLINGKPLTERSMIDKGYAIFEHIDLAKNKYGDKIAAKMLKAHYPYYSKSIRSAVSFRKEISKTESTDQQKQIVEKYFLVKTDVQTI